MEGKIYLEFINSDEEYEKVLKRIEKIFDAQPSTREANELMNLVHITELYEEKYFPIEIPDPISAIKFRIEQQGNTNYY